MLIDSSYFVGPVTIAQLGQQSVVDDLNNFINRWEPIILEAALGYDFYQAFMDGLSVGSDEQIDQRWMDLLHGVTFTSLAGYKKRFVGLAGGQNTQSLVATQRDDLTIYAGTTPGFSIGSNSFSIPGVLGWNYQIEIFGAGTLNRGTDWNYTSTGASLSDPNYKTQVGERWILHFTDKKVQTIQSGTQNLVSPLANFIYYEYMANLTTQATGSGIKKSSSENAENASPNKKLADAFNEGVKQISLLWEFLWLDTQKPVPVYPEFEYRQVDAFNYGYGYVNMSWQSSLYHFWYINPLF